jgi:hypothetical protein
MQVRIVERVFPGRSRGGGQKAKNPSELRHSGFNVAERAGFEPAVGY